MAVASSAAVSGPIVMGVVGQCSGAVCGWGWFTPTLQMMRRWQGVCAFFNQHPVKKEAKLLWFDVGLSRSKKPVESGDFPNWQRKQSSDLFGCNYWLPWVLWGLSRPPMSTWGWVFSGKTWFWISAIERTPIGRCLGKRCCCVVRMISSNFWVLRKVFCLKIHGEFAIRGVRTSHPRLNTGRVSCSTRSARSLSFILNLQNVDGWKLTRMNHW